MSGACCPRCDAPSPPGARVCARCGYRFVEDWGPARRPPVRPLLAAGGFAVLVVAVVVLLSGRGGDDEPRAAPQPAPRLQVLSGHPLSRRDVESAIEMLYVPARDDDTAAVACSAREAKPAHSVRRCEVRYANGMERRVVVLTTARGNEVLSKP